MSDRTELQRYPNSAAASLVKGRLAQDGIEASVRRAGRYQAMGGAGYVVSVSPDDLARARAILDQTNTEVDLDEYVDPDNTSFRRCPRCRSVMIARLPLHGPRRAAVLVTAGIALLFLRKPFRCKKCGGHWEAR